MGSVGSWVHKFTWQWVGLGQLFGGLGWAGSMKIDPRTTLVYIPGSLLHTQLYKIALQGSSINDKQGQTRGPSGS